MEKYYAPPQKKYYKRGIIDRNHVTVLDSQDGRDAPQGPLVYPGMAELGDTASVWGIYVPGYFGCSVITAELRLRQHLQKIVENGPTETKCWVNIYNIHCLKGYN